VVAAVVTVVMRAWSRNLPLGPATALPMRSRSCGRSLRPRQRKRG